MTERGKTSYCEQKLEKAERHFDQYKPLYEIRKKVFVSEEGNSMAKVFLRVPGKGNDHAVDILVDGGNLFYTGDLRSFSFGFGIEGRATKFFNKNKADPDYWSQKLWNEGGLKEFDKNYLIEQLNERIKEKTMNRPGATDDEVWSWLEEKGALDGYLAVINSSEDNGYMNYREMSDFLAGIGDEEYIEFNGKYYSTYYLYCCHAIRWISGLIESGKL